MEWGGVQYSATPINLKNLGDRVAALEGKTTTTPISMQDLANRIANIEATAKKWEIVTLNRSSIQTGPNGYATYNFDSKYTDYDFAILDGFLDGSNTYYQLSNGKSMSIRTNRSDIRTCNWSKNGNSIKAYHTFDVASISNVSATIKVLFYK